MEVCITGGLLTKFTTTDAQRPIPMFSYSCRIEFLPAYGQNWIQHPNGVAITHNLNPNFMGLLFYSMFPKVRNHGFAKAFLLGRFIIQNALLVNSTKWWLHFHKFIWTIENVLSARYKYRLHSRNSIFVIIADTTRLWQSFYLSQNISLLISPAYSPTKRIVWKALSFSTAMVNIWLPFKRA